MSTKTIQLTDGTDTVLPESAESGNGYCKMADGTLICWGKYPTATTATTQRGALYVADIDVNITFPQAFISAPTLVCSIGSVNSEAILRLYVYGTTGITKIGIARLTNDSIYSNTFNWQAIGRWK